MGRRPNPPCARRRRRARDLGDRDRLDRRRRRPASGRRFGHRRDGVGRARSGRTARSSAGVWPRRQGSAPDLPPFLIEHDTTAAEWTPAERAARARPRRLDVAILELAVDAVQPTITAFLRTTGLRFRPSLVGGGARDADIGRQLVRVRPRRTRRRSWSHGSRPDRPPEPQPEVDRLGIRWRITPDRTGTLLTVSRAAAPRRRAEWFPVALRRRGRRSRHACLRASRGRRSPSGACRGRGRPCRAYCVVIAHRASGFVTATTAPPISTRWPIQVSSSCGVGALELDQHPEAAGVHAIEAALAGELGK